MEIKKKNRLLDDATLPDARSWDRYWSLGATKKFTKTSWSKKRIIKIIQPFVFSEDLVLDAGCGSGFFTQYFVEQGMKTYALDYSQEALNLAAERTHNCAKLIQMDLVKDIASQHIGETFDIIFTDGLLEHFVREDQDLIMRNLISLLNPQGVLITFVPNRWSPWELIRPFYMPGIEEDPFVLSQLVGLNEESGLKVIAQGGINTIPFVGSPDQLLGSMWGMLLYTIAKKR